MRIAFLRGRSLRLLTSRTMPPDDAEVIDLTQDSPIRGGRHHFIELDSEGEVVGESSKPPTNNGKVNRRKRKKPRKMEPVATNPRSMHL